VALHPGGPIAASQLEHLSPGDAAPAQDDLRVLPYEEERGAFERRYMERLLDAAGGNVSEAARISGIARQNLYARLKRWGLS
jgi:two-component system, NtrC family, response regulator AtoC